MKHVKLYNNFFVPVNEGTMTDIEANEPFDKAKETEAAAKFEMVTKVTVKKVEADLEDEWNAEAKIELSNGGLIEYICRESRTKQPGNGEAPPFYSVKLKIDNQEYKGETANEILDEYLGSTGTLVGDLLLIYKEIQEGKLKPKRSFHF